MGTEEQQPIDQNAFYFLFLMNNYRLAPHPILSLTLTSIFAWTTYQQPSTPPRDESPLRLINP
jgi:hypothetical protein